MPNSLQFISKDDLYFILGNPYSNVYHLKFEEAFCENNIFNIWPGTGY